MAVTSNSKLVTWLLLLTALSVGNGFVTPCPTATVRHVTTNHRPTCNTLSNAANDNEDFWKQQQDLAKEMTDASDTSLRNEQMTSYQERLFGLVSDSVFYSVLIFCIIWLFSSNPLTAISYAFGATFGTAYSYGLGKYVETLGGSAMEAETVQGAGVGQARFAFLILLFIIVGKFRSQGLEEIPAIAGFFTYQIASLSQGLREYND